VLSFSFVAIIWTQGLYKGMGDQAVHSMIDVEYGGGQYWHEKYDPYDPLSIQDAHGIVPAPLKKMIDNGQATPVLITQGVIYPSGRFQSVLLKGIDPSQTIISLPSGFLDFEGEKLPVLIGSRMAKSTGLKVGDTVTLRWRDAYGTFDARNAMIVHLMSTTVQSVDEGQLWIPLKKMQELTRMEDETTLIIVSKDAVNPPADVRGWEFKSLDVLLKNIRELVEVKTAGASIMYVILLLLAMLGIFDTQVLSIFRRRKEIGTLMAMGLTRARIIGLFTLEGAMHSVLAAIVAAVYGIPLLIYFAKEGWAMPQAIDSYGFAIGEKLFPTYSAGLVIGTTLLVLLVTTIVSFLPTRKIAKLKPTDALRGKLS